MEFRAMGKEDYMGFTWYGAYENGNKVLKSGVHLQYKALDKNHAIRIHKQISKL
jgi:hypothetical protein